MKPAREPASSRPKPCASLKKPHESCPFAAPCGHRRKKKDRGQKLAFPSETSRFAPLILAHRGSALPWLVDDRAALRLRRIWCVPTRWSTTRLSATVFPASRVPPHLPKGTKLELGRCEHLGTPSSANLTTAASQPTGCWLHLSRVIRAYTRRKDPPTRIPRNQVSEGEGTRKSRETLNISWSTSFKVFPHQRK